MSRILMIVFATVVSCAAAAQNATPQAQSSPTPQLGAPGSSAPRVDPARQVQLDLDQMESLLNNMAAQVSFIRDTNMSILLNTNVQLWSVLIRDMRMQLQQQQRAVTAPQPGTPH